MNGVVKWGLIALLIILLPDIIRILWGDIPWPVKIVLVAVAFIMMGLAVRKLIKKLRGGGGGGGRTEVHHYYHR